MHATGRSAPPSLPWLLSSLVVVGCSASAPDRSANTRDDTLATGTVVVTNTGDPVWSEGEGWRLEEDMRLGTADDAGSAAEQFAFIGGIDTDSRGRIYVLELVSSTVRVFEPDGSHTFDVGGAGEGPGELSRPAEISIGPGDTLWVAHVGGYSIFSPEGSFVRTLRRAVRPSGQLRGRALSGGRYLEWGFSFPNDGFGRVDLFPVRVTGASADTFPPIEFSQRLMEGGVPAVFFSADPTGAVDETGAVWFAHRDAYRIHRRTIEGDTTLSLTFPAEPHPLEPSDRERVEEAVERQPTERRTAYLEALPAARPIIAAIVPDDAGHVYVLVDVAGEPAGTALDVFTEQGAYLGRTSLPVALSRWATPVIHATADHVYVVIRDDLDVPYVSRLRIIR